MSLNLSHASHHLLSDQLHTSENDDRLIVKPPGLHCPQEVDGYVTPTLVNNPVPGISWLVHVTRTFYVKGSVKNWLFYIMNTYDALVVFFLMFALLGCWRNLYIVNVYCEGGVV